MTRPFTPVHYFDAAGWKIRAPGQCEEAFAQGGALRQRRELIEERMITAGAMSSISNWNAITTAAAQIHQSGPAHSISFNTSASNGNPSKTASKNPFNDQAATSSR